MAKKIFIFNILKKSPIYEINCEYKSHLRLNYIDVPVSVLNARYGFQGGGKKIGFKEMREEQDH